jgi:hypothetical protein
MLTVGLVLVCMVGASAMLVCFLGFSRELKRSNRPCNSVTHLGTAYLRQRSAVGERLHAKLREMPRRTSPAVTRKSSGASELAVLERPRAAGR